MEELFSSLRKAGSCMAAQCKQSRSPIVRQTKVAISSNQLFFTDQSSLFKRKTQKKKEDRGWKAIPFNPTAEAGRRSLKCISENQWKGKAKTEHLNRLLLNRLLLNSSLQQDQGKEKRVQTKTSSYTMNPSSFSPQVISSWHMLSACTSYTNHMIK